MGEGEKRAVEDDASDRQKKASKLGKNAIEAASSSREPDSETSSRGPVLPDGSTGLEVALMPTPIDKREIEDARSPDEAPGKSQKIQKISSICFGLGASDKLGELTAKEYNET